MKKTILTVVAVCLFVATGMNANNSTAVDNTVEVPKISVELNSFCKAIVKGDVETVKKLIELGEDVDKKSLGMAPIHYAARYNRVEIVELLLANGANAKKKCDKGYTAAKYAELSGAMEALQALKAAMKK
ncbi:ankyrin repeat domain-containing protein [Flagellimonas allohymeniacidonis]|uniref:Ankyrin repeat domain-containing protein n=1 Tax=Flagellimonas allohymeniacidonis TaxID=2517819 RepID=A0A4Q8QER8_9FLAO|nr:ankyrin repeat domain-containing protein [Allomuricauda hymeniacidonis]TAI46799.1 ankyrin repeat domain-containing protein [Allomuricauda hymeniacidonis]